MSLREAIDYFSRHVQKVLIYGISATPLHCCRLPLCLLSLWLVEEEAACVKLLTLVPISDTPHHHHHHQPLPALTSPFKSHSSVQYKQSGPP